jgi:hypothetical protein
MWNLLFFILQIAQRLGDFSFYYFHFFCEFHCPCVFVREWTFHYSILTIFSFLLRVMDVGRRFAFLTSFSLGKNSQVLVLLFCRIFYFISFLFNAILSTTSPVYIPGRKCLVCVCCCPLFTGDDVLHASSSSSSSSLFCFLIQRFSAQLLESLNHRLTDFPIVYPFFFFFLSSICVCIAAYSIILNITP